jgi:hypothetical protein
VAVVDVDDGDAGAAGPGWVASAAAWYSTGRVRVSLTFDDAYTGVLRVYALDWNSPAVRRQTVSVFDGVHTRSVELDESFFDGRWVHAPLNVPAGTTVVITADRTGGANAVIAGLFLGDAP